MRNWVCSAAWHRISSTASLAGSGFVALGGAASFLALRAILRAASPAAVAGAINAADELGHTPLDFAEAAAGPGCAAVRRLLRKRGARRSSEIKETERATKLPWNASNVDRARCKAAAKALSRAKRTGHNG